MTRLVFSYAHADEALRNELEKHLSPLKRTGEITTWHDRRIVPGQNFANEIDAYFSDADIILLLISSDFIASDYCYQIEMTNAIARHDRGDATVIPVILRECAWHKLPFGRILAATQDGKPITKFATHDEGYVQVVNAVSLAIATQTRKRPTHKVENTAFTFPVNSIPANIITNPRSGNLSLPVSFTDLDRDRARREGFDYVARYFENSLAELEERYEGLETVFSPSGSDTFSCAVYIHGSKVAQCHIQRNAQAIGMGDILFSYDNLSANSFNESLRIDDNGQSLGFKAMMGGGITGQRIDGLLTNEGMAEYLWTMFFRQVQQRAGSTRQTY